jgi:hypothetical protein
VHPLAVGQALGLVGVEALALVEPLQSPFRLGRLVLGGRRQQGDLAFTRAFGG